MPSEDTIAWFIPKYVVWFYSLGNYRKRKGEYLVERKIPAHAVLGILDLWDPAQQQTFFFLIWPDVLTSCLLG